ncbi:hypothetical protein H0H87_000007 [Tephrocybe sp. NHM501043]|nr:hypothetical protein H0H87_000007 [Tephrocybe sp. NHM501043]
MSSSSPTNTIGVWSNFEIADLDLWRSEAYSKFFDFLDEKGGFYYEAIDTNLSNIALKEMPTLEANVGVTSRKTLVSIKLFRSPSKPHASS